ncbi:bifunctional diguanylate cyclase/phosphodiesterase [Salisediminibacterium selenitireducens]|uniref:bifunctional diguanylate cyclase/phosphodiesterase n=1 Tax=Salisediminibacterium selenitireducens TaxID=85683 RepID=UPI00030152A6|nr:GGDEF domain-containing protein [Salisediminibacterium selenitireducens]
MNTQNRSMLYEQLELEGTLVTQSIDHFIGIHEILVEEMANNRMFTEFVNREPDGSDVTLWEGYDDIVGDLATSVAPLEAVHLVYLALEDQNQFVSNIADTGPENLIIGNREWYRQTVNEDKVVVSEPYIDAQTGTLAITVSKVIKDQGGYPAGAVGLDLTLDELVNAFSGYGIGESGRVSVFDQYGSVIYDPLFGRSEQVIEMHETADPESEEPVADETHYYFLHETESSEWKVISSVEIREVTAMGRGFLMNVVLIVSAVGLLVIGLAYVTAKHMMSPIVELDETIRGREDTELGFDIPISILSRHDEVGSLGLTLSEMSISIHEYVDELRIRNDELKLEIDNHMQTQNELRLMLAVLAETNQAFFIVDSDLHLVYQNQASDELVSHYEERKGWKPKSVLAILDVDRFRNELIELVEAISWETSLLTRDYQISVRVITHKSKKYYLGIIEDVSDRNEIMQLLDNLQTYDDVTGVMHKDRASDEFAEMIEKKPDVFACIIACDIDGLSTIFNAKGEAFINDLLMMLSERLREVTGEEDIIGRSTSEFLIYKIVESDQDILFHFKEMVAYLNRRYLVQGEEVYLPLRFGIATYPDFGTSIHQLTEFAITALNYNKLNSEQKKYSFYEDGMKDRSEEEYRLYTRLSFAIERQELSLALQPQVDARTGTIIGFEALIRWTHEGQPIRPDQFIPVAEKYNLMLTIGDWVMEEAIRMNRVLIDSGKSLPISINVSAVQFNDPLLISKLQDSLERYRVPAELIKIEITENTLINHKETCIEKLSLLHQLGVKVSIDDFGTGYSSLSYLRQFKVNELKIDRSFISGIPETDNGEITELIITLADKLDLSIVAEGAETREQVDFLCERGAFTIQGYYYYKPLMLENIMELV